MRDPFLIDECLTLDLVAIANARGHHATHVAYRNLEGTQDHALIATIHAEGFALVTGNGRDFIRLYQREALHPGLIVLVPGGMRGPEQVRLFGLVLDFIDPLPDLVNKLIEVSTDGVVRMTDISAP